MHRLFRIKTLRSHPVEWARSAVGTRFRFALLCAMGMCLALTCMAFTLLVWEAARADHEMGFTMMAPMAVGFASLFILFAAGVLPIQYLVALRGVLRELDRLKSALHDEQEKSGTGGEEGSTSGGTEQLSSDHPSTGQLIMPRFSLRFLLIVTAVICLLLAALVPSLRQARRATQHLRCTNHLRQIAAGLCNYYDTYESFPCAITYAADGTPMHSWRVQILSYLERGWLSFDGLSFRIAYDVKEPWNGPKNALLGDEIPDTWNDVRGNPSQFVYVPSLFRCPLAPRSQNGLCTNYVMLIDDRPGKPNGPPNLPGSVPPGLNLDWTVTILEIANSDIHWMEPRDMLLSELSLQINGQARDSPIGYHGGACVAHGDGRVEILDHVATAEYLQELLTQ